MITAIILAAGSSSRMGRSKLELDWHGRPMLDHVIDSVLETTVDQVLVVTSPGGTRPNRDDARARTVVNPRPDKGMGGSIRTAMAAISEETCGVMVVLADKPLIKPATLAQLLDLFDRTGAPIVYPTHQGKQGHPVLFGRKVFEELRRIPVRAGAKHLLTSFSPESVALEVEDPGVLVDIDTPDDYTRALQNEPA